MSEWTMINVNSVGSITPYKFPSVSLYLLIEMDILYMFMGNIKYNWHITRSWNRPSWLNNAMKKFNFNYCRSWYLILFFQCKNWRSSLSLGTTLLPWDYKASLFVCLSSLDDACNIVSWYNTHILGGPRCGASQPGTIFGLISVGYPLGLHIAMTFY